MLRFLNTASFEPLRTASLRALSQKVLFLLALATAKRVGELQALSRVVSFVGSDACLSYVPEFVAKSESLTRSIPFLFSFCFFSLFVFMRVPAYNVPWGCALWTHDVTSDLGSFGIPSRTFQDSVAWF